ncbi:hypothetical protein RBEAN4_0377 [Rickettsia bellii str. RML An4]|uniref:Uncharacterized protein n=1 Tax=Rickettsia bellii str. RML An4 TaxID=1359193 RepID=A0A0F3Q9Z7_RICBE|nr:hypothetical protein RBEAN4_0377 [Rickettsia bellii str. RML An4]
MINFDKNIFIGIIWVILGFNGKLQDIIGIKRSQGTFSV